MSVPEIDWKRVALGVMAAFGDEEGALFERSWSYWGVPEEWHAQILEELAVFEAEKSQSRWVRP